jgi:hypothetical protein
MKVGIGTIRSDYSGFDALAAVAKSSKELFLDSLELDFSGCRFFEANMAAPLYAVLTGIYDNLNRVAVENLPAATEIILRKNQFLTRFGFPVEYDSNLTTVPFKIFKINAGEQFSDYLESYMQGKGIPPMSVGLTKKFRQSLLEIFQNASIHSVSAPGIFACGQFFPQKNRIDFTIADAGVGIRQNVRNYLGNQGISSCEAIKWALQEGHTTRTGKHPGGLGLKLIKDFINLNKGKIQIVSRYGFYQFTVKAENYVKMTNDFPGTCINIEINTNDPCRYCLKSELKATDIF